MNEREPYIMFPEVFNADILRDAITEILESEIVGATKKGAKKESVSRLTSLLYHYQDLLRVELAVHSQSKSLPLRFR